MRIIRPLLAAAAAAAFAFPASAQDGPAQPAEPPQATRGEAAPAAPARPSRASAGDLVVGAQVLGGDGQPVGKIESTDGGGAVVATGNARARLELDAFYKGERGLLIGYSRAEFETLAGGRGGPEQPDQ